DVVIDDTHFPAHTVTGPQHQRIVPGSSAQKQFLAIGAGAHAFIRAATAAGVTGLRTRIPLLTQLTAAWTRPEVDQALATAATVGRFLVKDVESILQRAPSPQPSPRILPNRPVCPKAPLAGTCWDRWPNHEHPHDQSIRVRSWSVSDLERSEHAPRPQTSRRPVRNGSDSTLGATRDLGRHPSDRD